MLIKKIILNAFFILILPCTLLSNVKLFEQSDVVLVHAPYRFKQVDVLIKIFNNFDLRYELVDHVDRQSKKLHVLFDVDNMNQNELPEYYIVFQTKSLDSGSLDIEYKDKLSQAVAVWDYSVDNIAKYKNTVRQFHYLPENYQYSDPVILPCLLPTYALNQYRQLLMYVNSADSDISSHLPALFCATVLQKPSLILELGINEGGQSTVAFKNALSFCNARLLGVDILPISGKNYAGIHNGLFVCMNDLNFMDYYRNSEFYQKTFDIIFIDTSHEYAHTMQELDIFLPLMSDHGFMAFHDSNVTPLNNNTGYVRLNGTNGSAVGNTRGVTRAIKEYFSLNFNEHNYYNSRFEKNGQMYHIVHYPFCNGLTIIKKV